MAYNYYPTQFYQNPFQQIAPQQQTPQQMILWVDGDEEAAAFPMAPNSAVRLWHRTSQIVYFKSSDAAGRVTLEKYDYMRHVDVAEPKIEYAAKADLEAIREEIKTIRERLEAKE